MSREILFRGKSGDGWHYGLLTKYGSYKWRVIEEDNNMVTVKTDTIGQFTGLIGKNGTKIFEGDIVRIGRYFSNIYTADDYVCRYDTDTASFKFYYIIPKDIADVNKYAVLGDGETLSGMGRGYVVENVVGNIYDNINYEE